MSKTKIWLITAFFLVLIGCIVFAGVMTMLKWDFTKLSTAKYETNVYEIEKAFEDISIDTDTADITFVLSENEKCVIKCYEEEKSKHYVAVEDSTLVIKVIDNKSWYDYIGINFGSPKITVHLPKTEYNSLFINASTGDVDISEGFCFNNINISLSTGDIRAEKVSANGVNLSVSTGRIDISGAVCKEDIKITVSTGKAYLTDVKCKNLVSWGDTGDISLTSVIASEKLYLERDTGDITFEKCDASDICIKTSTGDVKGTLLTEKIFVAQTSTGKIDVPKTVSGGRCEITTSTGSIKISILKESAKTDSFFLLTFACRNDKITNDI